MSFPYAFNFSTFLVKKAGAQLALVSPIQDLVMESFVPKCSAGARMGKGTKKKICILDEHLGTTRLHQKHWSYGGTAGRIKTK